MLLSTKYKFILLLFLFFIMAGCSFHNTEIKKASLSKNLQKHTSVKVIKDDNLSIPGIFTNESESINLLNSINSRMPVFILTSTINSSGSIYGQSLCDSINNDFSNDKYVCIVQNQPSLNEWVNYLKKDDLSVDSKADFTADFLVTRVDYLIEKQSTNTGPLKDFPVLDAVMFLNGNYLFLWGDNQYQATELSHFITMFSNKNHGQSLKIAVNNSLAKQLLTKLILANKWATDFEFVSLDDSLKGDAKKGNYNLIADAGCSISKNVEKFIEKYHKNFVPLSLSNELIDNTQRANPEISKSDLARYYNNSSLTNIVRLVTTLESEQAKKEEQQENNKESESDLDSTEDIDNKKSQPFVTVVKYGVDYDKYVFGKSKFDFNIKSVSDILKEDKIINVDHIKIMGIGIKNVLVTPRITDPMKIYTLLSSFLSKYDLMKVNYATPDMASSNIRDILLGNLNCNNLIYHYGVINFITYANSNKGQLWGKEAEIVSIISKYLDEKNTPPFYGPNMPNVEQVNIIKQESFKRTLKNKQEKELENFQSLVDEIKGELILELNEPKTIKNEILSKESKLDKTFKDEKTYLNPLNLIGNEDGSLELDISSSTQETQEQKNLLKEQNKLSEKEGELIDVLNDLQDLLENKQE